MNLILYLTLLLPVFATSPTNDYTPGKVKCPGTKLTRLATAINSKEVGYISNRGKFSKLHLTNFLHNANMSDFDIDKFLETNKPIIGLAFSGGGYRAMLSGAGQLAALDSRVTSPDRTLAGLLQSSSYITGLSGGSWLIGSLACIDFPSVEQVMRDNILWNFEHSILDYYGLNVAANKLMWAMISLDVLGKQMAGFATSITDPWGRALSYQLLSTLKDNGDAMLWSDITNSSSFKNFSMPFPIISAVCREHGTYIRSINSTVIEFTPYEMGSWDPSLNSFVDIKYLGTNLDDGIPKEGTCMSGYDNAGFIMGTSSSVFNEAITELDQSGLPSFLIELIKKYILTPIERHNGDVANYHPNPFYNSKNQKTRLANSDTLLLVDGAEDGQNIPLVPLLNRNVDVIFAHDNSANTDGWPDGRSLIATYERQFSLQGENLAFPYVPDQSTFRNLNLTSKPAFFGCDAQNLTTLTDDIYGVPVVVYLPNRPFSYWSNTSTFKLVYSENERRSMIRNGYEVSTRKNGTLDSEWAACMGCAIIRRSQERNGQEQSEQCKRCFKRYCWDGTIYSGPDLGDNFSDEGLTKSDQYYNKKNTPGFNNGATKFF
ncbi:phospholipase B2 [Spathaspora passalidarum NRRL Y-27907]|uniref:Lysophospholipase n=1 Tax=Spathaspora passalidarum (strain NRRL Y-27907 / 11-Y1) TaxID=619300 RepID=G3AU54_SPAPN|nr:phospholipase B2 [Spathaspora passalidarum NRRL Y-27907]EGW30430.1 phospholipase B2 [Spathaspora passalidarum NRRL Y-27907]